jgi:hypothetical protein
LLSYLLPLLALPLTLVVALAFAWLIGGRNTSVGAGFAAMGQALGQREALLALLSILLAAAALALLPWPWNPLGTSVAWLWAWLLLELAIILPLVAALFNGDPLVVRAAMREVQIGLAARCGLWLAISAGLSLGEANDVWAIAARLAIGAVGVFALPPAIGWGPFAAETSLAPAGPEQGLSPAVQALISLARLCCATVLSLALLIAALPIGLAMPVLGWPMLAAGMLIIALLLRQTAGRWPRMTMRDALNFCWWRVFPLSLVALVCLLLASVR